MFKTLHLSLILFQRQMGKTASAKINQWTTSKSLRQIFIWVCTKKTSKPYTGVSLSTDGLPHQVKGSRWEVTRGPEWGCLCYQMEVSRRLAQKHEWLDQPAERSCEQRPFRLLAMDISNEISITLLNCVWGSALTIMSMSRFNADSYTAKENPRLSPDGRTHF